MIFLLFFFCFFNCVIAPYPVVNYTLYYCSNQVFHFWKCKVSSWILFSFSSSQIMLFRCWSLFISLSLTKLLFSMGLNDGIDLIFICRLRMYGLMRTCNASQKCIGCQFFGRDFLFGDAKLKWLKWNIEHFKELI